MLSVFRQTAYGLAIVAAQWLIFGRLRLWGAYPDAVLLFVAWLGLRYGRRYGAVGGFGLGLLMDAIYGTWGIQMFTKTLVGFLLGLFPAQERESLLILPRQAFVGGLVIALVHNGIMVTLLALESGASNRSLLTALWIGSACYTAGLGYLAALFRIR